MAEATKSVSGKTSISALKTHLLDAVEAMERAVSEANLDSTTTFKYAIEITYEDGKEIEVPVVEEEEDAQPEANKRNKNKRN